MGATKAIDKIQYPFYRGTSHKLAIVENVFNLIREYTKTYNCHHTKW
jgi:hypothetical protein